MSAWGVWLIIAGVLALVLALLLCPVVVQIEFSGAFVIKLRVLGIPITVFRQKTRDTAEKKSPEAPEKKKEKSGKFAVFGDILKREGLLALLDFLKELASISAGTGKRLLKHIHWRKFSVLLAIGGQDAAKTAVQYGQACAVVYPAAGVLTALSDCSQTHVGVIADFKAGKTKAEVCLKADIRPIFVLTSGVSGLIKLIKAYRTKIAGTKHDG